MFACGSDANAAGSPSSVRRADLRAWLAGYEEAWRSPGVERLSRLFAEAASYRPSPFEAPIVGLDAIAEFWVAEREGPDEVFEIAAEIVAVDGRVGVIRLEVVYGDPATTRYRDLWIVELGEDGRCVAFEEWPFFPGQGRVAPVGSA